MFLMDIDRQKRDQQQYCDTTEEKRHLFLT